MLHVPANTKTSPKDVVGYANAQRKVLCALHCVDAKKYAATPLMLLNEHPRGNSQPRSHEELAKKPTSFFLKFKLTTLCYEVMILRSDCHSIPIRLESF